MSERPNDFLYLIQEGSDEGQDITENEWKNLLLKVTDAGMKDEFEKEFTELQEKFNYEGDQIHKTTSEDLKSLRDFFGGNIEKMTPDFFLERFLGDESYDDETKTEYMLFVNDMIKSKFTGELSILNISKLDSDSNNYLTPNELFVIEEQIKQNFQDISKLGSYNKFLNVYKDVESDINSLAFNDNIDIWLGGKGIAETLVNDISGYSKKEADGLLNAKIGDENFGKGLVFAAKREFPQVVEDIIFLIADLPFLIHSIPQYSYYKWRDGHEYDMKVREMESVHPILALVGMLSNGKEVLSQLISKIGSPSEWTAEGLVISIATVLGTVLTAGAGLVKGVATMGKMSKIANGASKVQKVGKTIDKTLGGDYVIDGVGKGISKLGIKKGASENLTDGIENIEEDKKIKKDIDKVFEDRKKLHSYVDELVENTDVGDVAEKDLIGKTAKGLIDDILTDPNLSQDSLQILKDVRKAIIGNMGGLSLRSLTHILESFTTASYIPFNKNVQDFLNSNFGDISDKEYYAQISIFHDLVKNTFPTSVIQFVSPDIYGKLSTIKGGHLSSHQLDSANYLRNFIDSPDSDIYKTFENFLESRGIPKEKTPEYIESMAKVIEGHGGNTEFIQADTVGSIKNVANNIDDKYGDLNEAKELINGLIDKGTLSSKKGNDIISRISEISSDVGRVEFIRKSFIKEFIENNIGKQIDIEDINMQELEKIFELYGGIDKKADLGKFINSETQSLTDLQEIIDIKTNILLENGDLINKYLHTNNGTNLGMEGARFSFNINDIAGYVNPATEGFTKLIMFNDIDSLISSPMNSSLAVLSELKVAISKETDLTYKLELETMYDKGLSNMQKLGEVYQNKLAEKLPDNAPDYFKDLGLDTFGEAYTEAIGLLKGKNSNDFTDLEKSILQYFKMEFKDMCLDSEMQDLFI